MLAISCTYCRSPINISDGELAQIVGASRESTNKQLRDWESLKWIRLERGEVILIDTRSLAAVAAGET